MDRMLGNRLRGVGIVLLAMAGGSVSCQRPSPNPEPALRVAGPAATCRIRLADVSRQTGVRFVHSDGSSGQRYIVETITAGTALFDYDNDGDIDIYFLNGAPLRGWQGSTKPRNALYRNEGNWKFTDVTDSAGVGVTAFGLGVAVADYDNDADPDLFVCNYGPNMLFANNGDGTFTDVTDQVGVVRGDKVGAGVCFLDADGDGVLDLYVGNYVNFAYDTHYIRRFNGFHVYLGPRDYQADPDQLYRGNGDGTFTDISAASGIGGKAGTTMGLVAGDFDRDADTDIAVNNDVGAKFLWMNDGHGKFEETGLISGFAYNELGDELGSMGLECGDYDNDGLLDLFMTSYQGENPVLYRNTGAGSFQDVTQAAGAGDGLFPHVNWGIGFVDFDQDGDRDLYVANGHLQDNIDLYCKSTAYRVRNELLMNTGDGKFVNVTDLAGDGLRPVCSSRAAVFDDLDADGDIDAVILNSREAPTILKNETPPANHWLRVNLVGRKTNRDGIGAQVIVTAGDLVQVDEVHSGRSYQSHYGLCLHFGLAMHDHIQRLEVRWIGGGVDVIENIRADQVITVLEGGTWHSLPQR